MSRVPLPGGIQSQGDEFRLGEAAEKVRHKKIETKRIVTRLSGSQKNSQGSRIEGVADKSAAHVTLRAPVPDGSVGALQGPIEFVASDSSLDPESAFAHRFDDGQHA